jgi:two-component system, LytTR family, sensor histidine kinase AlgZ
MHPILARAERLTTYLAAWLIVAVLLAAVVTRQGLSWLEALALLLPMCLVYAFMCLSAWYVCRATPLGLPGSPKPVTQGSVGGGGSGVLRVLSSSALAAVIASGLWVELMRLWVSALVTLPPFSESAAHYAAGHDPLFFAAGVLLFLLALTVHYLLLAFELARQAEQRQLRMEVLAREAELRALRAQLDPHFLFNSLNSISALTAVDPAGARRMCVLLADFLRDTLNVSSRDQIPLVEELALTDRFLGIEQVRFGDRLQVERHVDGAAAQCRVPPLLLQPLVENAVTHGIAGLLEGGVIRLDVSRRDRRLSIAIENPRDAESPRTSRRGVGLENVRQRLIAMFGADARLDAHADDACYRVELAMPCLTDD